MKKTRNIFSAVLLWLAIAFSFNRANAQCPSELTNDAGTNALNLGSNNLYEMGDNPVVMGISAPTNGSPCALHVEKTVTGGSYSNMKIPVELVADNNNVVPGESMEISISGNGISGNARVRVQANTGVFVYDHTFGNGTGWSTHSEIFVVPTAVDKLTIMIYPNVGSTDPGYSYFDNLIVRKVSASDTEAPTAPTNLSGSPADPTTVDLNWSPSTDNIGVTGYTVFTNGGNAVSAGNNTNFQVTGLAPSTSYTFEVQALDAAGNASASSDQVTVTTPASTGGGGQWADGTNGIDYNGNVGIGTNALSTYKLAVEGKIRGREVRVDNDNWADYVFESGYDLPTLEEVQKHIEEKGHLINIPSAQEVEANGIELGEMNRLLLEKIEELTLYILQQEKRIIELERE